MSKYQEVAKRVIEILDDDFILDMEVFNNADGDDVSCGTAFCLVGWMAYKDKYPKEFYDDYGFNHVAYSESISGCKGDEWEFLFGGDWSNDRTKAKARAQYVIDNDDCPNLIEWGEYE